VSEARDDRWDELLAAARAWRSTLIPKTSTGLAGPTARLIGAIEKLDAPCAHPRLGWVFHTDGRVECSSCGEILTQDVQSDALGR
jgi:hypothetical protein